MSSITQYARAGFDQRLAQVIERVHRFAILPQFQRHFAAVLRGKAERGPTAIEAIRKHEAVYLMAVGGAAYLVSKAIKKAEVVAFPELGMEAIYEFEVQDMPVTVAVDSRGKSVHQTGPQVWRKIIEERVAEVQ